MRSFLPQIPAVSPVILSSHTPTNPSPLIKIPKSNRKQRIPILLSYLTLFTKSNKEQRILLLPCHFEKKQKKSQTHNYSDRMIQRSRRRMEGEYNRDTGRIPSSSSSSSSKETTSVHVTALDGLVNVNSLFTIAVFVGLSLTAAPGQFSLRDDKCKADRDVARKLVVFEVVSFSFFLFSSLVAQGLKLALNLLNSKNVDEAFRAHINLKVLRLGMLGSAVGSVMGCVFLMLSMVNVIEIRLGLLSCRGRDVVFAVVALITLVFSGLVMYISTAMYAFTH